MENNNLRFHEQEKQQKKYRATNFKAAMDMAQNKKKAVEGGRQYILPSSFTHGKRCYSQRYYDGNQPKIRPQTYYCFEQWLYVWQPRNQI
jgi:hypothetical protein